MKNVIPSMSNITKHPLLTNPTKHIPIPKKHIVSNYNPTFYPSLTNNPYALALNSNVGLAARLRSPRGNTIQLSAEPKANTHEIFPVLDRKGYLAMRYINNSEVIVRSAIASKSLGTYIPLKYLMRNKIGSDGMRFMPHFAEKVEEYYRSKIHALAKDVKDTEPEPGKFGVFVTGVEGVQIKDGVTLVDKSIVGIEQVFVNYEKHRELADLIIKLVNYKSI